MNNIGTYSITFLLQDDDKTNPQYNDKYKLQVQIVCKNTQSFNNCPSTDEDPSFL
jgi:hypothetical protein